MILVINQTRVCQRNVSPVIVRHQSHFLLLAFCVTVKCFTITWYFCDSSSVCSRDVTAHAKGNSNFHGARPVHLIITMIKWIRTRRLSIKNSLSHRPSPVIVKYYSAFCIAGILDFYKILYYYYLALIKLVSVRGVSPPIARTRRKRSGKGVSCDLHPCVVRTGSWTGPPRGKRAPRVGISSTVFGVRA